jgi:hypothetical protein
MSGVGPKAEVDEQPLYWVLTLIHVSRSLIRIRNRDGLQRTAGGFYGAPEAEYDRLFGTKTLAPRKAPT